MTELPDTISFQNYALGKAIATNPLPLRERAPLFLNPIGRSPILKNKGCPVLLEFSGP
jgi:hypothetical protein